MSQGEFRRIDQDEGPVLGPQALLLCGYSDDESRTVSSFLETLNMSEHRVVLCTEPMLTQPLAGALSTPDEAPPVPADMLPRIIVLSGMDGAQVRWFLDGYSSTLLPKPIFATTTPANLHFPVRDLLVGLLREHQAMKARR